MRKTCPLAMIAVAIMAAPLSADVILRFASTRVMSNSIMGERTDKATSVVTIGAGKSRLDWKATSFIYDSSLTRAWMVFHRLKGYMVFSTPINLRELISKHEEASLAQFYKFSAAAHEIKSTPEEVEVEGWKTKVWNLETIFPLSESASRFEVWLTRDLVIDEGLFEAAWALQRIFNPEDAWLGLLEEKNGIPVRVELERNGRTQMSKTMVLENFTPDAEVPEDHYSLPEGYEKIPFRLDWFFTVSGGTPIKN